MLFLSVDKQKSIFKEMIPYISWSTDTIPERESVLQLPLFTSGENGDPEKVPESPIVSVSQTWYSHVAPGTGLNKCFTHITVNAHNSPKKQINHDLIPSTQMGKLRHRMVKELIVQEDTSRNGKSWHLNPELLLYIIFAFN